METIDSIKRLEERMARLKGQGKEIGLVPTMGALHEGHLSLIRRARDENDVVVLSIFVNPIQFNRKDDYLSYPRNQDRDKALCFREGVDFLFVPKVEEMYQEGFSTYVEVEGLTDRLCGASRPGHFRGVTTVVTKLFNIVRPDRAYFGQKDFQQTVVIKRMVRDLNLNVEVLTLPTIREADGLALSSRNQLLRQGERQVASALYRSLLEARELFALGIRDSRRIIQQMHDVLHKAGIFRIDYITLVDLESLEELEGARAGAVVALAAWVGNVRLIDNMTLEEVTSQLKARHKLGVNV
ncbi:MAG TPA: pantoate--beta-alanine ligase [Candidatus Hypogeohydataceae bacterium YC41]